MRTNQRTVLRLFSLALIALTVTACSKVPEAEVQAADQALQQARSAAADYAPESLQAAEDARVALDTELQAQEETFALRRSYDKATQLAVDAKAASDKAVQDAATGKERAREDSARMIEQVRSGLVEVQQLLDTAPKGKGNEADLAMLKSDLGAIESSLPDLDAAFDAEQFTEAKTKAQAALDGIDDVRSAVTQALEMSQPGRRN